MLTNDVLAKIKQIVGSDNVQESEISRFGYSYDSSFVDFEKTHQPDVVVQPLTTEEVAQIVSIAYEHGIPVTPQGTCSGRTGGSIPTSGGIALSLSRMDKIIELDERNMMVTVEPGVRTMALYNHCAEKGLFYPPDPASWKYSTLGGNIAENAGGMRAVKYGVTNNYVMGLEVVLADGSVIQTGGKAIKNVTGYNLTQLFVGSEGTLGIVTRIILRLIPMPKVRKTMQLMFTSLEDGCDTIHKMLMSGTVPAAAELMDKTSIQAVARHRDMDIDSEIEACIIVEIDGENDADLDKQSEAITIAAKCFDVAYIKVADSLEESEDIWAIRRGLSSAIGAIAPNRFGEDISVPRDAFPEMIRRIKKISEKYGLPIAVYGHAGDGNVHPSVLCDMSNLDEAHKVHHAISEIFTEALAVGGTLSGEHGIGITKKKYMEKALGKAGILALKGIKQALDPKGIFNPGKIWEE